MAKGLFRGNDIELYLTPEEVIDLGLIRIAGTKIEHIPLDITLETDTGERLQATVQQARVRDQYGDGITVERRPTGFYVQISEDTYERMDTQARTTVWSRTRSPILIAGTRYNGSDKINFWLE